MCLGVAAHDIVSSLVGMWSGHVALCSLSVDRSL